MVHRAVDTETEAAIDRLRQSRSRPVLRLIGTRLDHPADADAAVVVEPYRWLLERIGDGVKLTQAGYLPPASD